MTEMERWMSERRIKQADYIGGYERWGKPLGQISGKELLTELDHRRQAIERFSFAILTEETVQKLLPHGPFLEIGAGTGYWCHELCQAGTDAIATDPAPYTYIRRLGPLTLWPPVERLNATNALKKYPGRTLLMVWPSYQQKWPARALSLFSSIGGSKLVYVGEGPGHCCADDAFFDLLEKEWEEVEASRIPCWDGVHDCLTVYEKK